MAILDVAKKGLITIKTAAGYVKILPRTLATLVEMSDGKSVEQKITELNGKLTTTKSTVWTNATIIRKDDMRIIILGVANIANKVTLSSGDRPSSDISASILINGNAAAVTVKTSGVLDFSNVNGYVTSGNAMGQIVYMV